MHNSLRVLLVGVQEATIELLLNELRQVDFSPFWHMVITEQDYTAALSEDYALILFSTDHAEFDCVHALHLLHTRGLDIPFIIIASSEYEEHAIACLQHGAADYLFSDRLRRLGVVVTRTLHEQHARLTIQRKVDRRLQHYAARAEVLTDMARLLAEVGLDYQRVLDAAARHIAQTIGDDCIIRLLSKDRQQLELVAFHHINPQIATTMGELLNPTVSTTIEGLKVHVIQTGEPVLVPVLRPETIRQIIGEHECQLYIEHIKVYSLLIVPLRVPGRVIGTVGVTRRTPDTPYTLEDQTFLQDVSDQAALAIVNADLHRTLQQELAERKQIEHVLRDMQGNLERRVEQRTKELSIINEKLRQEIGERTRIEEALRESEARYRLLAEYATDLISRATIEGINLYISPACRTMLGYEAYEITGHSCYTFLHPEDREHVQAVHTWLAHNTATDSYTVQYRFRCKDDSYVWLETISTLLYNQRTGTAQEIISVSRNITERKQAEEEIRRLNAVLQHQAHELEATTHELEAFSHSISHELRAPLRAIEGFSRMLYASDIVLPSDARHMVSRIQANTEHMQRLIDNLLTFARFNRHPLTRADVDLSRLVQQVYDELQPEYQGRQIEFIVGPLPTCQSDPVLLKQVFANMLSNALKFTRPRDVARIEVGVQPTPDGSVYFVRDNGVGFDMRYASRLFNVFQRLHTTDEYEGTGIGLSIVQRIIHRHGGRIWVESERNSGTTFYFTL